MLKKQPYAVCNIPHKISTSPQSDADIGQYALSALDLLLLATNAPAANEYRTPPTNQWPKK